MARAGSSRKPSERWNAASERAVSSVIGTILMVSITVIVFGGVAVVVMGEVNNQTESSDSELVATGRGNTSLVLRHTGGEPIALASGYVIAYVDGIPQPSIPLGSFASSTADQTNWVIGEFICLVGNGCYFPAGTNLTTAHVAVGNSLIMTYGEQTAFSPGGGAGPPGGTPQPDLRVTQVTAVPGSPFNGQSTTFTARVINQGTAAVSDTFTVQLTWNAGGSPLTSAPHAGGLNAGASMDIALPAWTATTGTHTYAVTADNGNAVTESNEGNNVLGGQSITVSASAQPDLVVTSVTANPSNPSNGQSTTFTARVTNQGSAATSGSFSVQLTWTSGGTPLSTTHPSNIAAGAFADVALPTWSAVTGTHSYTVTADNGNAIAESNEGNNARSNSIVVSSGGGGTADPGFPYDDVDGDGEYGPGDTALTPEQVENGYTQATGILTIPASTGTLTPNQNSVWSAPDGISFGASVIADGNQHLTFESANGDVYLAPGLTVETNAGSRDININAGGKVTANGVHIDAGNGYIGVGKSSFVGGDVFLQGATLIGGDHVMIRANGDIHLEGGLFQTKSNGSISVFMNDSADLIYIEGARFQTTGGGTKNANGDPNGTWTGTVGPGSGNMV